MNTLNPSSPPSGSGARIGGDDLQHLVVWYWCLKMLTTNSKIVAVCVEADVDGNLDDVTVDYEDGQRYYAQVKASVSAKKRVNAGWFKARRSQSGQSLLQKLFNSWNAVGRPSTGIELITSCHIDPEEPLLEGLDHRNLIGNALRRATCKRLTETRATLACHVGCTEEDLCDFFDVLVIRAGQNEAEWCSRVNDVAMGVSVRSDHASILTALGWIREWVKDTRDPRGVDEVKRAVGKLGLWAEDPRALVVVQGIDLVCGEGAIETLDWMSKFRGDSPETRRGLVDPANWNGALTNELSDLKTRLRAGNHRRILFQAALRLPCWFAIGTTFREVADFDIAMKYRGQHWAANMTNLTLPSVNVRVDEDTGKGRTVVVVAISTDATDHVRASMTNGRTGRLVTVGLCGTPSPSSLQGPEEAMAAAVAVRDWVRRNICNTEIDLVLMAPAPFALFLGHVWDRMPPTTIHEDLLSGYEPAFCLTNTST